MRDEGNAASQRNGRIRDDAVKHGRNPAAVIEHLGQTLERNSRHDRGHLLAPVIEHVAHAGRNFLQQPRLDGKQDKIGAFDGRPIVGHRNNG